jgi:hypothetical protein
MSRSQSDKTTADSFLETMEMRQLGQIYGAKYKGKQPAPVSFAELVAENVITRKAITFLLIAGTALLGQLKEWPEWMVAMAIAALVWIGIDILTVVWRVRSKQYGEMYVEVLEAARFVARNINNGKSGGRFDRTFDNKAPVFQEVNAAGEQLARQILDD